VELLNLSECRDFREKKRALPPARFNSVPKHERHRPKGVGWHAKGLGGTCKCRDAFAAGPMAGRTANGTYLSAEA